METVLASMIMLKIKLPKFYKKNYSRYTQTILTQFLSGLFLRRAMILISGGSGNVSIAEQQSSVDLERDNMFKHFHGALMLSAWPLHFAQKSLRPFLTTIHLNFVCF